MRPVTAIVSGAAALATALLLGGCTPTPPTTSYLADDGSEVTVLWQDYPGHAHTDEVDLAMVPDQAGAEAAWAELRDAIEAELTVRFGFAWHTDGEAGWYAQDGNAYGGDSMYTTYNSEGRVTDAVPDSAQGWQEVVDIVSAHTEEFGLGAFRLDHSDQDAQSRAETVERNGTDDPREFWIWSAIAHGSSQWVGLTIVDIGRDRTGKAAEEWAQYSPSISLSYGATTVADEYVAVYADAMAPFAGLDKPAGTTSD